MDINSLNFIYITVLSLFLIYGVWIYYYTTKDSFVLLKKSFKDKTGIDSKSEFDKVKIKTQLIFCFLISYLFTIKCIQSHTEGSPFFTYAGYLNGFFFILGLILMLLFHYRTKILAKMNYYRNIVSPNSNTSILEELKPNNFQINTFQNIQATKEVFVSSIPKKAIFKSYLAEDELKSEYNFRIKNGDLIVVFDDFNSFAQGKSIVNKITWLSEVNNAKVNDGRKGNKKISKSNLLDMYKVLFNVDYEKLIASEIIIHVNNYFSFISENFPNEKEMNANHFSRWKNK